MPETARRPVSILAAGGLAGGYAVVLLAVAVVVGYQQVSGTGHIGSEHLDRAGVRGVVFLVVVLAAGAALLGAGVRQLMVVGRRALLVTPLVILLGVGTIGEIADAVGSATATSDLIGLAILVLAALPVLLVSVPASRAWAAGQPGRPVTRPR